MHRGRKGEDVSDEEEEEDDDGDDDDDNDDDDAEEEDDDDDDLHLGDDDDEQDNDHEASDGEEVHSSSSDDDEFGARSNFFASNLLHAYSFFLLLLLHAAHLVQNPKPRERHAQRRLAIAMEMKKFGLDGEEDDLARELRMASWREAWTEMETYKAEGFARMEPEEESDDDFFNINEAVQGGGKDDVEEPDDRIPIDDAVTYESFETEWDDYGEEELDHPYWINQMSEENLFPPPWLWVFRKPRGFAVPDTSFFASPRTAAVVHRLVEAIEAAKRHNMPLQKMASHVIYPGFANLFRTFINEHLAYCSNVLYYPEVVKDLVTCVDEYQVVWVNEFVTPTLIWNHFFELLESYIELLNNGHEVEVYEPNTWARAMSTWFGIPLYDGYHPIHDLDLTGDLTEDYFADWNIIFWGASLAFVWNVFR